MRLWRRRQAEQRAAPSPEACEALRQAQRELLDAERLDFAAKEIEARLQDTRERNHFAEAVIRSMRRAT